jgi:lysyl-tRNA synthetase class 2
MAEHGVWEVETPALVHYTVTDPQLQSLQLALPGATGPRFLHTSPEYAMKRLLAAGSGDIYQLGKAYRAAEDSRLHNAEFTMLEWYRVGWSMAELMAEVDALARVVLAPKALPPAVATRYADALALHAGIDLARDTQARLVERCIEAGLAPSSARSASRDQLLDFLVAVIVGPRLGRQGPEFLTHYPASQAALARLAPDDPEVALRFELYWQGIELANGFEELADAREQARRFEADRAERLQLGLPVPLADPRLLAALRAGLPACAGVALGFDRLVMLALGERELSAVLSFSQQNA